MSLNDTNESSRNVYISYDKALRLIHLFDGRTEMLHNFVDAVDFVYDRFDPTDIDTFQFLVKARLEGAALNHICTLEITTWPEIRNELFKKYGETLDIHSLAFEMTKLKQYANEKPLSFVNRVESQLLRIKKLIKYNSSYDKKCKEVLNEYQEKSALIAILSGLKEPAGQRLRIQNPTDISALTNLLIQSENQQFISKQTFPLTSPPSYQSQPLQNDYIKSSPHSSKATTPPIKVVIKRCTFCQKLGHEQADCFARKRQESLRSAHKAQIVAETLDDTAIGESASAVDITDDNKMTHSFLEMESEHFPPNLTLELELDELNI